MEKSTIRKKSKKDFHSLRLTEYLTQTQVPLIPREAFFLRENHKEHVHIAPSFQGEGLYDITPRHYVGHITLPTGRVLIISPKCSLGNLFYLLTYAYHLADFKSDRVYYEESSELLEFLVRMFIEIAEDIIQKGIYKAYILREENKKVIRGKILFSTHLKENQWRKDQIYCQHAATTVDTLENRILKFTLLLLGRQVYYSPDLVRRLQAGYCHLDEVSWVPIQSEEVSRVVYTRLNQHYRTALSLCELFLQSVSVQNHPGEVKFFSFLLDMNRIFERFVARILQEKLTRYPSLSLSIQEFRWLDRKATRSFIPDLILYKKDKPVLVLDTKYKGRDAVGSPTESARSSEEGPDSEDLYQILVYCQGLGVKTGILLYPTYVDWQMETREGISIKAWGFDLQRSPSYIEAHFKRFIRKILKEMENHRGTENTEVSKVPKVSF